MLNHMVFGEPIGQSWLQLSELALAFVLSALIGLERKPKGAPGPPQRPTDRTPRRLSAFQGKLATVSEIPQLMVRQQLDEARPQPARRVHGLGPVSLQFKLPFLASLCIHLPAMGFADDR